MTMEYTLKRSDYFRKNAFEASSNFSNIFTSCLYLLIYDPLLLICDYHRDLIKHNAYLSPQFFGATIANVTLFQLLYG